MRGRRLGVAALRCAHRAIGAGAVLALLLLPSFVAPGSVLARAPPAPIRLVHGDEARLACPGVATLELARLVDSATNRGDRFAILTLSGVSGPLVVEGEAIGTLDPEQRTHVLLKPVDPVITATVACVPGARASLTVLDAPIVEVDELPARVLAATFTRAGLRAVGIENFVEATFVSPVPGNVTYRLTVDGAPLPSTLQAFGEDANESASAWSRSVMSVVQEPVNASELVGVLGRLALLCSRVPSPYPPAGLVAWASAAAASRPESCAGAEVERALAAYHVPAPAARDLAQRLAADPRCGVGQNAAMPDGLAGFRPLSPLPCIEMIAEWLAALLEAEGLPPLADTQDRLLRALGVGTHFEETSVGDLGIGSAYPFEGPCGDDLGSPGIALVANRTRPTRALECAELLVASLRPVRAVWREGELITRMVSLEFGASSGRLAFANPAEGKLTLATQGPAIVDLALDPQPLPTSLGEATRPALQTVDDARGSLAPVAELAEAAGVEWPERPAVPEPVDDALDARLDGNAEVSTIETGATAAEDVLNGRLAPMGEQAMDDVLEPACVAPLGEPLAIGGCLRGTLVWSSAPADTPPASPALAYSGGDPASALAAFLAPPGTPITAGTRGVDVPYLDRLGRDEASIFVPHRLHVSFEDSTLPTLDDALAPPDGTAALYRRFAHERFADLVAILGERGLDVPMGTVRARTPYEVVLTGTTFHLVQEDGVASYERIQPTYRVLNLGEGLARGDYDLDGMANEAELSQSAYANVTYVEDGQVSDAATRMDPFDPDSDDDGLTDGYEHLQCADNDDHFALCAESLAPWRAVDAAWDSDFDSLDNRAEYARTVASIEGTACFARARWACVAEATEAALAGACDTRVLLAWSEDVESLPARSRDSDCDGAWDGWELRFGFDPQQAALFDGDADRDGLSAGDEFAFYRDAVAAYRAFVDADLRAAIAETSAEGAFGALLDPGAADTDLDGLPDGYEAARGLWPEEPWLPGGGEPSRVPRRLAPAWPTAGGDASAAGDPDRDGISTLDEYRWSLVRAEEEQPEAPVAWIASELRTWGLDPFRGDTDGDGLGDVVERAGFERGDACMDPVVASLDCDGDGLRDEIERYVALVPQEPAADWWAIANYPCKLRVEELASRAALDWLEPDADADEIRDGFECWFGLDPTNEADAALDAEGDGLTSLFEYRRTLELHANGALSTAAFDPTSPSALPALLPTSRWFGELAFDRDTDGLPDSFELAHALPTFAASSGDDADRDGLTDLAEYLLRDELTAGGAQTLLVEDVSRGLADASLVAAVAQYRISPVDVDSDGDSMPDGWEHHFGLNPFARGDASADPDGDGLSNAREYAYSASRFAMQVAARGTRWLIEGDLRTLRPTNATGAGSGPDSDADGMSDGWELRYHGEQRCAATSSFATGAAGWRRCFDPLSGLDAREDFDGDGLSNLREHDGWDVTIQSLDVRDPVTGDRSENKTRHVQPSPLRASTAGDGLFDPEKAPQRLPRCAGAWAMDPWARDSDGDGVSDRVEVWEWTAVQGLSLDVDGDCFANAVDVDSDGDSYAWGGQFMVDLRDGAEIDLKISEATRTDTDGDSLPDGRETFLWRAFEYNPVDPASDFDADSRQPLRDRDSDGDLIFDDYEFGVGLPAWRVQSNDTDLDLLTDLCEYLLTKGARDPEACDEEGLSSAGPETAGSTRGPEGPDSTTPEQWFDFPDCVNARNPDCDRDGLPDGFEHHHANLGGCAPGVGTRHWRAGAPLTDCFVRFMEDHAGDAALLIRGWTLAELAEQPSVRSLRLDHEYEAKKADPCFYHRACRMGLVLGGQVAIVADLAVHDPTCSFQRVIVRVTGFAAAEGVPSNDAHAACATTPEYVYALRARLTPLPAEGGRDPTLAGTLAVHVDVVNGAGATIPSFASGDEVKRLGFSLVRALETALAREVALAREAAGRQALALASGYLRATIDAAKLDPDASQPGQPYYLPLARDRAARGVAAYMEVARWYAEPSTCGDCTLAKAVEGKKMYLQGSAVVGSYARPAYEGLAFAIRALVQGGVPHDELFSTVQAQLRGPLGATFSFDDHALLDILTLRRDATFDGGGSCGAEATLVDALATAIRDPKDPKDLLGTLDPSGLAEFESALESVSGEGDRRTLVDLACVETALTRPAPTLNGRTNPRSVAAGATLADLVWDVGSLVAEAGSLDDAGIAAGFVSVTWTVIEIAVGERARDPGVWQWMLGGCLLTTVASSALALASPNTVAGVIEAFAGIGFGMFDCFDKFLPSGEPRQKGRVGGIGMELPWSYAFQRSDSPTVLSLNLTTHGFPDGSRCPSPNGGYPPIIYQKGVTFNVVVERLAPDGSWHPESVLRVRRVAATQERGAHFVADQRSEDPASSWSLRVPGGSTPDAPIEARYGGAEPGIVQVTVTAIPEFRYVWAGFDEHFPQDRSAFPTAEIPWPGTHAVQPPRLDRAPATQPNLLHPGDAHARDLYQACHAEAVQSRTVIRVANGAPPPAFASPRYIRDGGESLPFEVLGISFLPARSFDLAPHAPGGPGLTYFWDFGDGTTAPTVTTSNVPVSHVFTPGREHTVQVVVVGSDQRILGEDAYSFYAESPSRSLIHALRDGAFLTVSGELRNAYACVSYRLLVGGVLWEEGPPCAADSPPATLRIDARRAVRAHGETAGEQRLPPGSEAVLEILQNGIVEKRETIAVSGQPPERLSVYDAANGWFNAGAFVEVDRYTLRIPEGQGVEGFTFEFAAASRGMKASISGPVGGSRTVQHILRSGGTQSGFVNPGLGDLGGTEWTITVRAGGGSCQYGIRTWHMGPQLAFPPPPCSRPGSP